MNNLRQRIAAFCGLFALYVSPVSAQTWDTLRQNIRKRFPDVRQLSTQQLADWLADSNNRPSPILIDVRRIEEFKVSHLPGAHWADTVKAVRALPRPDSRPIVVYCSVGYRSSALAGELQKAGLTNVWNLEGSIFAWANEGRPVHRGREPLVPPKVHPYDKKWGQLLNKDLRDPRSQPGTMR
jgi:rhodanese-related sulfurtransferase